MPVCPTCGRPVSSPAVPGRPLLCSDCQAKLRFPGFEILELIGKGGMGHIYKARQLHLDRVVALKVIRPELLDNDEIVSRFKREAKSAARLAHPNVVGIYDAGESVGRHFLVMEYIEGDNLATLVLALGALPAGRVCEWGRQAALGLAHIHERNLVHRDIKPENLLVNNDRTLVKILDLGLARLDCSLQRLTRLTQLGVLLGTPAYLSPEQALNPSHVDGRSDIYSLGCTLYHLLTGRLPFGGDGDLAVTARHLGTDPLRVDAVRRDLPRGLAEVIHRMIAKLPASRYQTAAEVAAALAPFAKMTPGDLANQALPSMSTSQGTGPLPVLQLAWQKLRGRPRFLMVGLGIVAAIVLLSLILRSLGQ
jgi:serine/threonine protein kinase